MSLWKPIAWFAAGSLGGAVGTLLLLDGDAGSVSADAAPSLAEAVTGFAFGRSGGARANAGPGVAERFDIYRDAQQESDALDIARVLERLAARAWSAERDLEIDALLWRLAEIAPDYAAELTVTLRLDTAFVTEAWLAWAGVDADAAIAGLARIRDAAARREVALALTDVVGDDARSFARIETAFPLAERDVLRIEWLAQRAATDPFDAFREASAIGNPTSKRLALSRIAVVWAAEDPYGALAQADLLPQDLARSFRSSVFSEWARVDAEAYVAYLESATELPTEAVNGLSYLLALNPLVANSGLLDRVADSLPGTIGQSIRASALSALAFSNPDLAMSQAETLPPGQLRDMALQAVSSVLAESDPDAALEWVQGLSPPSPNALRQVTLNVARQDPLRLFALLDDPASGVDSQLLLSAATSLSITNPSQLPVLADGLLGRSDLQSSQALQRLVGNWMQRDPESALDWVLAHGTAVDANVFASAAQTMAARNPVAAAEYVNRLPQAQRGAWITQVAAQYGRRDPHGAMAWVAQFQGTETYEVAVRQLITNASQTDPYAAAQMLTQASATVQLGAAPQVASALAQQDPRAAVSWAEALNEPRARTSARNTAITAWYTSDPNGARRYALALPGGAERDQLLSNFVLRSANSGSLDRSLLSEFSSDSAGQTAVSAAVALLIATNNTAQARALMDSHITDPALRAQIERQLAERAAR